MPTGSVKHTDSGAQETCLAMCDCLVAKHVARRTSSFDIFSLFWCLTTVKDYFQVCCGASPRFVSVVISSTGLDSEKTNPVALVKTYTYFLWNFLSFGRKDKGRNEEQELDVFLN